uniref:Uncharacterized protein n=1 Tax=Arundo donax TaxID=35708 RepID=A0A0A9AU69_ARUDO
MFLISRWHIKLLPRCETARDGSNSDILHRNFPQIHKECRRISAVFSVRTPQGCHLAPVCPPMLQMRLSYHRGTEEMPGICVSIYTKEFQKPGRDSPAKECLQACLLVAVKTTFLQKRAIVLCKERVNTDPQERED